MGRPPRSAVARLLVVAAGLAAIAAGLATRADVEPSRLASTRGELSGVATTSTSAPPAARSARAGPSARPITTTNPRAEPSTTSAPAPSPPPPPAPPAPVAARPVPPPQPPSPPPTGTAPPWAQSTSITSAGYVATDVGCAGGIGAGQLDTFFRGRTGPVIGHDYQHVYDLRDGRSLWLFQDTFVDHGGTAARLDQAAFAHNTAMVQDGSCFTLLHRGSVSRPGSFEPGIGERTLSRWFWPLGGETVDGRLHVFWAEMSKTADPTTPDGLGWVPVGTWLATYRTSDLARLDFRPAPDPGVNPIYGYAVASDATHTYLFGNTFDQNLARQGGYSACPCSATAMWLARVPKGGLDAAPEYWTGAGWSVARGEASTIGRRFHAENPMQPRYLGDQWVAVTKADGYWGEELVVDVAADPWGPWTTTSRRPLSPRGSDPLMNTYHAHLVPWLDNGALVVSVSQNARDMPRHAYPQPERYRLQLLSAELVPPPPPPSLPPPPPPPISPPSTSANSVTAAPTTTSAPTSTTSTTTTSTSTTSTTTTSTTSPPSASTAEATTTASPAPPCAAPSSSTTSTTSTTWPSTSSTSSSTTTTIACSDLGR